MLEALVALAIGSLFLALAFTLAGSAAGRLAMQRAERSAILLADAWLGALLADPATANGESRQGDSGRATIARDAAPLVVTDEAGAPLGDPEAVPRISVAVRGGGPANAPVLAVSIVDDAR